MPEKPRPAVLFVCVKNAGKSQMAAAITRHLAPEVAVFSAGTRPGTAVNEASRASVERIGATMNGEHPKPVDPALLGTIDRVVLIGAEATLDQPPKAPMERWDTIEPSNDGIEGDERMDLIRDDITNRVRGLLTRLRTEDSKS
ncbi:low molecular weight phosphatase family protein [Flexivirga alba]|uniref:Low molecular weight phosphatase family protein n=1 Tax=Flexivirga alba TaxID=702742 RepID=A0ABW2AIL6_9MICO